MLVGVVWWWDILWANWWYRVQGMWMCYRHLLGYDSLRYRFGVVRESLCRENFVWEGASRRRCFDRWGYYGLLDR